MQNHYRSSLLFTTVLGLVLGACNPTITITRTGPRQPPKKASCQFRLFTTLPEGYIEIGTIDSNKMPGGDAYRTLPSFKRAIRRHVCEAGGDAAVAKANGEGEYFKAAVLKRDESDDGDAPAARKHKPKGKPSGGCQYDTQCKGDRICVEGKCVDSGASP